MEIHQQSVRQQRNAFALCWFWRPTRVRTLKRKLSASWRQLSINLLLMKRRHISCVFMTNGRSDTSWHSVLESRRFRVPAFDQRQHDLCGYCHLYVINMTWISILEVYFQRWCWRLAYAFCCVG